MDATPLIEGYEFELGDPECLPSAVGSFYRATARFEADASPVMPYLNAVLDRADYSRDNSYIRWKESVRVFILREHELALSPAKDRGHAVELMEQTVRMINDVWAGRDELEPDYRELRIVPALTIFQLLPRTNCRECGLASCMAFAAEVSKGEMHASECPPLASEEHSGERERLEELCG
ncbi:MAG: (Fe-S)-binding protein [Actinomycetota bacterium]